MPIMILANLKHKIANNREDIIFIALIFLIFFIPRIISLGSDMANVDTQYWYPRIHNFIHKLLTKQYQLTYQKYHPGVTLMWLSGAFVTFFETLFEKLFGYNPRFMPHIFSKLNFVAKFPIILTISILATYSAYLINKITSNRKLAYLFAILLSLEPYFLGVSRYLHLTALSTMFSFASFLSLIYYFYPHNKKQKLHLVLSAILMGLGILTKIDSVIIGGFNGIAIISFTVYYGLNSNSKYKTILFETVKLASIYLFITVLTFYLLFPSMWVSPYWTIMEIIGDGIKDTAFANAGAESVTNIKQLFYVEAIVLRASPILIITLLNGIYIAIKSTINLLRHKKRKVDQPIYVLLILSIAYTLILIITLTIPNKTKDRYAIAFFPALTLIGSIGLYYLYQINRYLNYIITLLLIGFYTITIYRYHPYYSYYYNDMISGQQGVMNIGLSITNRGEYYSKAANYINKNSNKPSESNTVLGGRFKFDTFRPYYYGTPYANPRLLPDNLNVDYIILEPNHLTMKIPEDKCELVKTFGVRPPHKFTALYIYKCHDLDNQYKDFRN